MRNHLQLLPPPRALGVEAITSAELLARKAARGDRDAECARLALLVTERTATIVALREELDEAREEIAALRALTPPRPSRLWAWWAALCLGWVTCWDWFETPESREGLVR